jgi:hypothetical protein
MAVYFNLLPLFRLVTLVLAASLAAACGAPPAIVRPAEVRTVTTMVVRGDVVDVTTRKPISGATVKQAYGPAKTTSGPDGTFALAMPAQGGAVVVSADGFAARTVQVAGNSRESLAVVLSPVSQTVAYRTTVIMQPGRLDGTGRVALSGDRLLVTGREGKLGALFNLHRVTGQEYDRFSWASAFNPLPMEIADVAAHPNAGTYLLTNSGRVFGWDVKGRYRSSMQVADGPGALAADGHRLFVVTDGKVLVFDASLAPVGEWAWAGTDPSGATLDALGNLWISTWDGRIVEIDADGRALADWRMGDAQRLAGIAVGPGEQIFVTDPGAKRVLVVSSTGRAIGSFGTGELRSPRGIAVDEQGTAYVGDVGLRAAVRFDRIPGTPTSGGSSLP